MKSLKARELHVMKNMRFREDRKRIVDVSRDKVEKWRYRVSKTAGIPLDLLE